MIKYKFAPAILAALEPFQAYLQQGHYDIKPILSKKPTRFIICSIVFFKNMLNLATVYNRTLDFGWQTIKDYQHRPAITTKT
jgi:hypothetical protein